MSAAPVTLWRIAAQTRQCKADDLSGRAAAKHPGRRNAAGEHVVYAAQTLSLAALETAAHLDDAGFPLNRFVVRLTVSADVWKRCRSLDPSEIEAAWCSSAAGKASVDVGSSWYRSQSSALLLVPSVIVQEESAVRISAGHPDANGIRARSIRRLEFNRLIRG